MELGNKYKDVLSHFVFELSKTLWNITKKVEQHCTLTGRVVISRERVSVAVVAMVSKQGLVVVVLIPVEGLDFEATSLGVSADDT